MSGQGGRGGLYGHGYVVGEVCQTENPLPFHPRRECEDARRHDKWQFFHVCVYGILIDRKYPRKKTPSLNHLKAKTVRLRCKRVQSIIIITNEATLCSEQARLFSISYKCGNGVYRG